MPPAVTYCRVPWLICVDALGAEADEFLRRQLTTDPPADDSHFTFAAWNDARGRVRGLFRIVRLGERIVLITEREHAETVLAKLRMFVLRSDVQLAPNDGLETAAVIGDASLCLGRHGVDLGTAPGSAAADGERVWLRLGPELVHVVGPPDAIERAGAELEEAPSSAAELAEIRLGLPRVGAALNEKHLPQMLNLDRLGGISFDKGCYPGQEVVARLHHRGAVKRRMQRFSGAAPPQPPLPGTELIGAGGESVGETVRAASAGDGRLELLAVAPVDSLDGPLSLAAEPQIIALERLPLPYDAGDAG